MKQAALVAVLVSVAVARPDPAPRPEPVLQLSADEVSARPTLCVVPEMAFIAEVDTWEPAKADAGERAAAFGAAWQKQAPFVASHLTPALARAMSGWAKPQMEQYARVSPLDKLSFQPVAAHGARNMTVYEATVDVLPSHNRLVKRWLKVYVLYAGETKAIVRVTVTIRGEANE